MKCYFLNVRKFISKSGTDCHMLTVADANGEVSDFFITAQQFSDFSDFVPFDFCELTLSVKRNRISVVSLESALVSN